MERLTHYETPEKHAYVDRGLVSLGWYSMTDEGFRGPAIDRLAAYEDTELTPEAAAQLKQIAEIFNCDPNDLAQLKQLCDKLRGWQQAEQDGRLVVANVSGRCGSCVHYRRIEGTARGACLKHPYGKDVICDPKNPYWVVGRSRLKCKLYEEAN